MNKFRAILEASLEAASLGKLNEALRGLSKGVRDAARENDQKWLVLLSKNAGLLFEKSGKLGRAKIAYRTALKHCGSDPYLHYSLAQICEKLGQNIAARRHFAACYRLATRQNEQDLLEILKQAGR